MYCKCVFMAFARLGNRMGNQYSKARSCVSTTPFLGGSVWRVQEKAGISPGYPWERRRPCTGTLRTGLAWGWTAKQEGSLIHFKHVSRDCLYWQGRLRNNFFLRIVQKTLEIEKGLWLKIYWCPAWPWGQRSWRRSSPWGWRSWVQWSAALGCPGTWAALRGRSTRTPASGCSHERWRALWPPQTMASPSPSTRPASHPPQTDPGGTHSLSVKITQAHSLVTGTQKHTHTLCTHLYCTHTFSLCSLRLMMTAVICWSMKMRMVQRSAGMQVIMVVHHGLGPKGLISQPRSSLVGWGKSQEYYWGVAW